MIPHLQCGSLTTCPVPRVVVDLQRSQKLARTVFPQVLLCPVPEFSEDDGAARRCLLHVCQMPDRKTSFKWQQPKGIRMSVKGHIKEVAGIAKEEAFEHGKSAESQRKAQEGRNLRNEGRIEDGKAPKTSRPGSGSK